MPKLPFSTQAKQVFSRQPLDYPPRASRRAKRKSHDLRACSTCRSAPACGAKRSVAQDRQPSRGGKRPRILPDPAAEETAPAGAKRSISQDRQSSRGAKRPRILPDPAAEDGSLIQFFSPCRKQESILWGADLRYCSFQIPISWGAKRVRSERALSVRLLPASQIPIWGAKRARSGPLLLSTIPSNVTWRDWANIGDGPAGLIAELLLDNDVADYIRFRAVCRPWRLCSTDPRDCGILERRFHPRQWVMLREKGGALSCHRTFISVTTGSCVYVDLPELLGHDVFGPTTEGLLVLLDRATYVVRLLNPLTRQAADLPPAIMLLSKSNLERSDLTEYMEMSGAGLAGDSTIAVYFSKIRTVAVAKLGDARWTVVDQGPWLLPAMSFAGRFYCANARAVMVVEIGGADHPPRLAMAAELTSPLSRMLFDTVHLVDNDGELILVDRRRNARKHKVYRVDLEARRIVPVNGLGGRAIFMGIRRAFSVSPLVSPSICADAIYMGFDDPMASRLDERMVHLMDGTTEARDIDYSSDDMPQQGPRGLDNYLSWCVTGYCDDKDDALDI